MVGLVNASKHSQSRFIHWLLSEGRNEKHREPPQHPWWQVMCLTGVDYFSTLGYQPGIAALAAGSLAPLATLILVLITLFGALPIYRQIAATSPHGEGSIALLENLLSWWQGKLLVLCLLGFVATDFIITITLSAADATAHIIENPLVPHFLQGEAIVISITLLLIGLLGGVFLRGFREAIGLAVILVSIYLTVNLITIAVATHQVLQQPIVISQWQTALVTEHVSPLRMLGAALLLFPRLALGLSGFETGVVVMPLVRGSLMDSPDQPQGRIHNTHKLLMSAALLMSFFLLASSLVTTLLIAPAEFQPGGKASGRALAYLAHLYLGDAFGTVYDLSTIAILWFAGASAMAGLLNVVPRYLPRYGMAPNWARASRPLVLVYTAIGAFITILFRANVDAQGGAYATGVLVLISSGSFAVTLAAYRRRSRRSLIFFSMITFVFLYTTIANIIERPEGIRIASLFTGAIILISLISRVWRSTELRVEQIVLTETAERFIDEECKGTIQIIANRVNVGDAHEYAFKDHEVREDNHLAARETVLFLEVRVADASNFTETIYIDAVEIEGYRVLRAQSSAVPNAIAAILLHIRDRSGKIPHIYFGWSEGNPIKYLLRFILFGEGDIPVVTREVLRRAESNPERRPTIHVAG